MNVTVRHAKSLCVTQESGQMFSRGNHQTQDTVMYQETTHENFSFTSEYDMNYTYGDSDLVTLQEHSTFAVSNAVCYSIIICISLPGNSFLLWVLLKLEGLKSSPDWLLLHLTVSDLVFTFTLVPWTIDQIHGWIFGELGCRLFNWGIFLGLYSYMMFLTVMTLHRYMVIVHPVFATSVGNRFRLYTHFSSTAAWLIAVGFSLPEAFFSGTVDRPDGVQCVPLYDSMFIEMFGYFTQTILFFLLPLLVIAFCYARMGFTIHKSHITSRNRHNAVYIILLYVVGFFFCWAPYNIFLFLYVLQILGVLGPLDTLESIFVIIHILAYSHCCLNPLIHIFGGRKFRRYLQCTRGFTWSSQGYRSHIFSNQSSFSGQTHL